MINIQIAIIINDISPKNTAITTEIIIDIPHKINVIICKTNVNNAILLEYNLLPFNLLVNRLIFISFDVSYGIMPSKTSISPYSNKLKTRVNKIIPIKLPTNKATSWIQPTADFTIKTTANTTY